MSAIKTDISDKLLDWYWQHGSLRKGDWQLSRGGWLDRMLKLITEAKAVEIAQTRYSKPTMALWGPSQSGKSTLLARFIDAGASEDGHGSAMSWDDNSPARFSGDNKGGSVAVLNPYNQGADASGCVTRFRLMDEVPYPAYPVELQFSSAQDILLSLAVGYMNETTAKDKAGKEVHWDAESLEKAVQEITKGTKPNSAGAGQEAFKLLIELLNVVDILMDMDVSRFNNLKGEWKSRRAGLLNNDALLDSVERVERLAAALLWDNWANLTDLFTKLMAKRRQLGDLRYYCSVEMAALFLNISAAAYYRSTESHYVKDLVDACCMKELEPGVVALTKGEGKQLFSGNVEQDFAVTQGLVYLIMVPLKNSVISAANPQVHALLEQADLVDFPGVANEHKSADLLTDDKLALGYTEEDGSCPMLALTQVLKRGKTASIVVSSARNLNIDAFSLLVRMPAGQQYPAQPPQLMAGIRQWFKSMGKQYTPSLDRSRELPINLILTFSATLLNLVNASGTGPNGLVGVFDKLRSLTDLANPEVVTTFCVNYPQFPDGKIHIEDSAKLKEVIAKIMADSHFKKQFAGTEKSLEQMAAPEDEGLHGGRIYLFENMCAQLSKSHRPALLQAKLAQLTAEWNECLTEALPTDNPKDRRSEDISKLINAITHSPLTSRALADRILAFQNLNPDDMDMLPPNKQEEQYVESQIAQWVESSKRKPLQTELGFESPEHRTRVLGYLRENIDLQTLLDWLGQLCGTISNSERKECRRLVAAFLVNQLFPVIRSHRPEAESIRLLDNMQGYNNKKNKAYDPYKESVVNPFIEVLEQLKTPADARERGNQPGDEELAALTA